METVLEKDTKPKQEFKLKKGEFLFSEEPEPHKARTREIMAKYPEIRKLMGRNKNTIWFISGIVGLQVGIAAMIHYLSIPWWGMLILAYFVGAFASHSLFTLIHEAAHNLIFKNRNGNLWAGILCDVPQLVPSSVTFRKYHLKHHAFQGHYDLDGDIANKWEAKLIGNSTVGKICWQLFYPVFQSLRPPRLTAIPFASKWTWINLSVTMAVNVAVLIFWGPLSVLYFGASLFFSIGFHPLGARWIQEHFLTHPPQETYSYYGPLNVLAFNVGYHNEHHDFPAIPWNNLPKVRKMASEYYDTLHYHTSWFKLWLQFLFDPNISLHSRTLRTNRGGMKVTKPDDLGKQKRVVTAKK